MAFAWRSSGCCWQRRCRRRPTTMRWWPRCSATRWRCSARRFRVSGTPLYTDVRLYGALGIPAVIYGAGPRTVLESNAKRADEHLVLEDLAARHQGGGAHPARPAGVGGRGLRQRRDRGAISGPCRSTAARRRSLQLVSPVLSVSGHQREAEHPARLLAERALRSPARCCARSCARHRRRQHRSRRRSSSRARCAHWARPCPPGCGSSQMYISIAYGMSRPVSRLMRVK